MDIRCPQCETLYEFDESRVNSGSATLKCRKCQHMFRLGTDAQPSREDQQRWMVRSPSEGDILYFNNFDRLHHWIVEREIDRNWEISRTGNKWKRLGDVGEFRPIFQVVDNVSSLEAESGPKPGTTEKAPERSARAKKDTLDQFDSQDSVDRSDSGTEATVKAGGSASETGDQFPVDQQTGRAGSPSAADSQQAPDTSQPPRDDEPTEPESVGAEPSSPPDDEPTNPSASGGQPAAPSPSGSQSPSGEQPAVQQPSGSPSASESQPVEASSSGARQRKRSPSPGPSPAADATDAPAEQSDVQLDSGRFGSQSDQEADPEPDATGDEWAFGDEDVGYDETTNVGYDESLAYEPGGGRRGTTVVLVSLVFAAGAAAYIWFFQRDLVDQWLASNDSAETVEIDDETKDEGDSPNLIEPGRSRLLEAVEGASDHARAKGIELYDAARGEAGGLLGEAVERASETADEKAEEETRVSTVDLLQDAQQALENGHADRARRNFHDVIDRDPGNSEAITGLGWSLLNVGKHKAAVAQFEKALHHNPSYGDAYIGLGQAQKALGNSREALDAYETYLKKNPGGSKSSIAEYQTEKLKKSLGLE